MVNDVILLVGTIISCVIISYIMFLFIEKHYTRIYSNDLFYIVLKFGICSFVIAINLMRNPFINLLSWMVSFSLVVIIFYKDGEKNRIRRMIESIVIILILSFCETIGHMILDFIFLKLEIKDTQSTIQQFLRIIFSKIIVIFFYHLIISKIWNKNPKVKFSITQFMIFSIIIGYSLVNLSVVFFILSNKNNINLVETFLLIINLGCIVFAELYLLFFAKIFQEKEQLKVDIRLLEQHSSLQYEFYRLQEEKYQDSIKIIHDINKHLKMIEGIYESEKANQAKTYTKEINKLLCPLIPKEIFNHPILNILFNDKKSYALKLGIQLDIEVENLKLDFMKPVEMTTVFCNLLDNAIEACEKVAGDRFIHVKLSMYYDFVLIHISNSIYKKNKWSEGKPVSKKGENHGIGLYNVERVINKYNGNMVLEEKNEVFICNILINKNYMS